MKQKSVIEFKVSDYTLIDQYCEVKLNGYRIENTSNEYSKYIDILKKASDKIDGGIRNKSSDSNKEPYLRVNINSRSKNQETKLINWDLRMINGFVGVVNVEDNVLIPGKENEGIKSVSIKITIKSRFDEDSPFFLFWLLEQKLPKFHDWNVPMSYYELFDYLLVALFVNQLKVISQFGLYRTYQHFERNDEQLKGTINFTKHIKLNMGLNNGNIAYSFRENTCDNGINHLILHAYNYLCKNYSNYARLIIDRDKVANQMISNIKLSAVSFNDTNIKEVLAKTLKPISHPYYKSYESIRKTSIMILRKLGISMFGNEDEYVQGILYYVPDLWEDCLEKYIALNVNFKFEAQEKVMYLAKDNAYEKNMIFKNKSYPDFVFYNRINNESDAAFYVMDAKFKPRWIEVARYGKLNSDYLQEDYNKCIRDMDNLNAKSAGVIFPVRYDEVKLRNKQTDSLFSYRRSERNSGYFDCVPIYIPEIDNMEYEDWKTKFSDEIIDSMKNINKLLDERAKCFK